MTLQKKIEPQNRLPKTPTDINAQDDITKGKLPDGTPTIDARIEELESIPHRNPVLHWGAFTIALMSLILLATWVFSSREAVPNGWIWIDVGLSVYLAIGFTTRSGFHQNRTKYLSSHFIDFIAIIPALVLVHHGFVIEGVWVWLILVARAVRVVDRFLGDGFIQRNFLALLGGFEEEITDRVLERIVARIQGDMDRASFSHGIAEAFVRNKAAVLQRVRAATPREGLVPGLAHLAGLDAALERAEERTYDAIVGIMSSEEIDHAIRDVINSSFSRIRSELGKKSWRQHLGLRRSTDKMKEPRPRTV